ncbi:MAG: sigma 54-interacting transcriptional regulator [Deltaproteobacteria bacterium]|nr:sigma 54-interacting transcriptional regulator [Myxococcales bacterium]MDP3214645.1 sigma 54-interacting transcriptional regulator [Deltaproteobacteria bacterium]
MSGKSATQRKIVLVLRPGDDGAFIRTTLKTLAARCESLVARPTIVRVRREDEDREKCIQDVHAHAPSSLRTALEVLIPSDPVWDPATDSDPLRTTLAKPLARYLGETLRHGMGRDAWELWLWWRPEWPAMMVAGTTCVATREGVRWWHPDRGEISVWDGLEGVKKELLRAERVGVPALKALIGSSPQMAGLKEQISAFARWEVPVLLVGETGTGKELVARAIHESSGRSGRFVAVNAALLDPHRAEDELCGHRKDAFTGANSDRKGRIREAEAGTFFLDELDSLPTTVQGMALRAFDHAMDAKLEVMPLGHDGAPIEVNARLVSATHQLDETRDRVRADLFFRVSGAVLHLPPLRDREQDAMEILSDRIRTLRARWKRGPTQIDEAARTLLEAYRWPGNVREVDKVAQVSFILASQRESEVIGVEDLRAVLLPTAPVAATADSDLRGAVLRFAQDRVAEVERTVRGSGAKRARSLGFTKKQEVDRYMKQREDDAADDKKVGPR